MKKFFSLLLVVALCLVGLSSCNRETELRKRNDISKLTGVLSHDGVVVIDSCEYVYIVSGYHGFLAHKGNCKYCEQRRKREQDKLVDRIRELLKAEEQSVGKPIESRVFEY